jgi:hypothetical protein
MLTITLGQLHGVGHRPVLLLTTQLKKAKQTLLVTSIHGVSSPMISSKLVILPIEGARCPVKLRQQHQRRLIPLLPSPPVRPQLLDQGAYQTAGKRDTPPKVAHTMSTTTREQRHGSTLDDRQSSGLWGQMDRDLGFNLRPSPNLVHCHLAGRCGLLLPLVSIS